MPLQHTGLFQGSRRKCNECCTNAELTSFFRHVSAQIRTSSTSISAAMPTPQLPKTTSVSRFVQVVTVNFDQSHTDIVQDCNAQKSPVVNAYIPDATFKGTCRGPYGILCSPDDVCEIFSFKSAEIPHDWGYCWTPGHFGDPDPSITSTVTSTSSVVSTLSGPSSSPSTSSVLSTSTVVQTTTVPPPTLVSVITTSVPFTTIVVKTTTVTPPTLVTVTTTVASTTSTNSDPCAIETAKECVTDEDCYPRFGYSTLHCDHSVECPLAGIDIEGYVCTGLCRPWHCEMP